MDCSEALNVHSDEKQGFGHCVNVDARSSSKDTLFSCHSNTDLLQGVSNCTISDSDSCPSADLANKLEKLLPDCLLENPESSLQSRAIKDDQKLKLADINKSRINLSCSSDNFSMSCHVKKGAGNTGLERGVALVSASDFAQRGEFGQL